jgi:hypothetical protein
MNMRRIILAICTVKIIFLAGCKVRPYSALADEGLYPGESFSKFVDQIAKAAGLPVSERLENIVASMLSSVFKIECSDGRGTGFFVGENGRFVSNSHVVGRAKPRVCRIFRLAVEGSQIKVGPAENILLDTQLSLMTAQLDHAYGEILSLDLRPLQNTHYLAISDVDVAKSLLTIGFPSPFNRDTTDEQREAMFNKYKDTPIDRGNKPISLPEYSNDDSIKSIREKSKLANQFIENRLDQLVYKQHDKITRQPEQSYPRISLQDDRGPSPPFASVGEVLEKHGNQLLTSLDGVYGASGSPVVDLLTGKLVGILSSGMHLNRNGPDKVWGGIMIVGLINPGTKDFIISFEEKYERELNELTMSATSFLPYPSVRTWSDQVAPLKFRGIKDACTPTTVRDPNDGRFLEAKDWATIKLDREVTLPDGNKTFFVTCPRHLLIGVGGLCSNVDRSCQKSVSHPFFCTREIMESVCREELRDGVDQVLIFEAMPL